MIRRFALASAVISAALLAGSSTARAADATIPLDTTIVAGTVGEQIELADVAGGLLVGRTCDLTALHADAGAPHPGNDLVVSSGADVVTLGDVERASGAVTQSTAPLTIGDTIRIEVILGPDAAFGGDVALEVDCSQGDGVLALPVTGFDNAVAAVLGIALVALGTGLTWLARGKRPRHADVAR